MQERLVLLGTLTPYEEACGTAEDLLGVSCNASQIFRLCKIYGEALEEEEIAKEQEQSIELDQEDVVYAEMDGSMLLTQKGWKEAKVGRVFLGSMIQKTGKKKRQKIIQSEYSACMAHCSVFLKRFERSLQRYQKLGKRIIFITDGAIWIAEWIAKQHPNALVLLDFYHVCEKLGELAKKLLKEEKERAKWLEEQKELLKNSCANVVIANIEKLQTKNDSELEIKEKTINYMKWNVYRMDYKTHIENGWHYGSGAIESAHKTLLQRRMKLSGQRWDETIIQYMFNLRVCRLNYKWKCLVHNVKNAPNKKAA